MSNTVSPLRISKASPAKNNGSSPSLRALAEVRPQERRRNSPSYNQATKKMIVSRDSSPFDSSVNYSSPRNAWQNKLSSPLNENSYDRPDSPSIVRHRKSIENLKKASRVKGSSMFAREQAGEYDPSTPVVIERPLASSRPLSVQAPPTSHPMSAEIVEPQAEPAPRGHRRGESQTQIPYMQPSDHDSYLDDRAANTPSPSHSRQQASPTKSALSNKQNTFPRNFDPSSAHLSDEEDDYKFELARPLRRQAKSVTFDVAPPQINEYEMVTPDPSSVASGSRESSYDRFDDDDEDLYDIDRAMEHGEDDSFDASLEDTEKTPVVLPEHWRDMSPDNTDETMAANLDDPFITNEGRSTPSQEWNKYRTASVESDRPLPPVPMIGDESSSRRNSGNILERVHNAHRSLPAPPPAASVSKSDILSMKDHAMSLEDRLRLMGIRDNSVEKSSPDQAAREKARLQRHGLGIHVYEDEDVKQEEKLPSFSFPSISRESILRKVKSRSMDVGQNLEAQRSPPRDYDMATLDPDVPIPSREHSSDYDTDVEIKQEDDENDIFDLYSVPAMYANSPGAESDNSRPGSVIHHATSREGSESVYSIQDGAQQSSDGTADDDGPPTPRPEDDITTSTPRLDSIKNDQDMNGGLPEFSILDDSELQAGLHSYLSSGHDDLEKREAPVQDDLPDMLNSVHTYMAREATPEQVQEEEEIQEPDSPASVLHQPIVASSGPQGRQSPVVPEPLATVKAPGGKLKTRPSLAPADTQVMAATRRQVSGTLPPPVPEKSPKRFSFGLHEPSELSENGTIERAVAEHKKRRESFRPQLEIPQDSLGEDLSFGLDREFDRVIESSKVETATFHSLYEFSTFGRYQVHNAQRIGGTGYQAQIMSDPLIGNHHANETPCPKKGYLMRQNTKVVVAKRNFSGERSSSELDRPLSADDATQAGAPAGHRPIHERSKSWTTEPWNGTTRRKSLRSVGQKPPSGPVPPLPGQESAVGALDTVVEDQPMQNAEMAEGAERGRLFVKVVGVKDLDLPLPQNERTSFQLTLDNGLHCVTTSKLELGRSAPIGQEFELVVLNELEFQLTLQAQIAPPAQIETPDSTPQKVKPASKKGTFSRFLTSPKKRREQERLVQQEREDEERKLRQRKAQTAARRANAPPSAYDLLHELVADDGSFGRAYVSLKNHEEQCYGRPITIDMPVFNEWALEDPNFSSSVKSKRGGNTMARRPPYQVGNLTLQLLYVPRPKGCKEEEMPKSMNGCVREMAAAERTQFSEWEGFLSQQGGDCPFWRRRFFRLSGLNLTAFHETTRQPRAKISLARANKLIDDKNTLVQPDGSTKPGKGRRKSAFAEEDQAYMFVEEGFRIRFANGEAIDFYADSADDKAGWMRALATVVGSDNSNGPGGKKWCAEVLRHERALKEAVDRAAKSARPRSQGQEMRPRETNAIGTMSTPGSPVKGRDGLGIEMGSARGPAPGRLSSRRHAVKSMIF
ncbi:DUF1709-domain-containing protein [Microthyrium microscopicum]|uniref:DUF1709-domain-containing protein n=1 Tax=Microthyrium microscopicum TaxID=703497 RepID=A0A6A6UTI1_9PEZI|nr:DUF1709-domain-containing protein [Microthyrium microscopicum]